MFDRRYKFNGTPASALDLIGLAEDVSEDFCSRPVKRVSQAVQILRDFGQEVTAPNETA